MAQNPTFVITMADGREMKGELYPETAPQSVGNFIALANSGFYDGLIFHRVIPGFMIHTVKVDSRTVVSPVVGHIPEEAASFGRIPGLFQ